MKSGYGALVLSIELLLSQNGPMTRSQLEDELEVHKAKISSVLTRMRRKNKAGVKRIYVYKYVYEHEGSRRYPRAVYAIGNRKDNPRPKADVPGNKRRYIDKKKALGKMNFVFNLGLSERELGIRKESHWRETWTDQQCAEAIRARGHQ